MKNGQAADVIPALHGRARRRWLSDKANRRKARIVVYCGTSGVRA